MHFLPSRHLKRPQPFPSTNQDGQKRDGACARNVFGTKKNIVVQACCGHLPHCSTFSKNFTISLLVSFDTSSRNFRVKPVTAHARSGLILLSALYKFPCINLGSPSSRLLSSSFLHSLSSKSCTSVSHCQCFGRSFLFSSHLFMVFASLSTSSNTWTPPLLAESLCLWNKPGPLFRTGSHSTDRLLVFFFLSPVLIFSSCPAASCTIAALCPHILGEATLFAISSQQFPDPPTVVRVHSAF